jgi:hypothetical protein
MSNVARSLFSKRGSLVVGVPAVLGVAIIAAVWLNTRPEHPARGRVVANNVSGKFRVCFLTLLDDHSDDTLASATWKGIQSAVTEGRVNAQRFGVPEADIPSALPYVNGALSQRCGLVVTVGRAMAPVVRVAAEQHRDEEFLSVGAEVTRPNVTGLPETEPDALARDVRSLIIERADH